MKPYTFIWWLVVLPTSVVVGGTAFLALGLVTEWGAWERIAVALILTLAADLAIAATVQAMTKSKVHIGPGETAIDSMWPAENATVVGGFGASTEGKVSVRGETWRAVRASHDSGRLSEGMVVSVVDRNGLTLVVATKPA